MGFSLLLVKLGVEEYQELKWESDDNIRKVEEDKSSRYSKDIKKNIWSGTVRG